MSMEAHGYYEREPESVEFSMVADSLRDHFRKAVTEQESLMDSPYRVFTIVDRSSGFRHNLARLKLVDAIRAQDDLQEAAQESTLDVALPIVDADPISPELVPGPEGDYFAVYTKGDDGEEYVNLVTPRNIISFLMEHQGFLSQVITSEVATRRKR